MQTLTRELASQDRDIASYEVKLESMHDALAQAQGEAEAASRTRAGGRPLPRRAGRCEG